MEYNQIIQTSRIYEYGEGKEFKTKQEALKKAQKEQSDAKTRSALKKLWEYVTKTEIVEKGNTVQVIMILEIPSMFE